MSFLSTTRYVAAAAAISIASASIASAQPSKKFLYLESNNIADGQNSVIAFECMADGKLQPHPKGPFLTGGEGINNNTNGKLGPNDNDSPIVLDAANRRLFAVNGHSDSIAVFDIKNDGSLEHVEGSPFHFGGVGPVSLALMGDTLLVANRNEDPARRAELSGGALSSYVSFAIQVDGSLRFRSRRDLADGQKNTQVLFSSTQPGVAFGNDFQVDADFDGDGKVSQLFGGAQQVRGRLHAFLIDESNGLISADCQDLVETADPPGEVPSLPLGLWDHPTKNLLYVGFVTRNQLGVYRYNSAGKMSFVAAVPNSGQDICWLRANKAGTRLFAVNNLPRADENDSAGTITVFDISGEKAEKPEEIQRVELPDPLGMFVNNRNMKQPNSAPFQLTLDESEDHLYVMNQRVNQTPDNKNPHGNVLHILKVDESGTLSVMASRDLLEDGVSADARPQGLIAFTMPSSSSTAKR